MPSARGHAARRYSAVSQHKAGGATYTPKVLSDFVAAKIVEAAGHVVTSATLRVLDPAVGHGELLMSLLDQLSRKGTSAAEVCGFETDPESLDHAKRRLERRYDDLTTDFRLQNFLEFADGYSSSGENLTLFEMERPKAFDLIIANPPYVRTQVMGASHAQLLAKQYGLAGRVDLYYPFILGIARALAPTGIAGVIVSNRFMTTRAGASVRKAILERFDVLHVWDLGDTKLFGAAVLPAVLLLAAKDATALAPRRFTAIYETAEAGEASARDAIDALDREGPVQLLDGRCFQVRQGTLDTSGTSDGVWRVATRRADAWLRTVENHTWCVFGDIGKIRVGVKTCADRVFIRSDWQEMTEQQRPELLRPVATHHVARRYRPVSPDRPKKILYPHEAFQGKRRPVDLSQYPKSEAYLQRHEEVLRGRKYVIQGGRKWFEIWVPQNPELWEHPKLVFRDIADKPVFWMDLEGSVVNGDCYWLVPKKLSQTDLLWLALAVGNSSFVEKFYDLRYHNKLYAGRRRFMTQYVERFPLPNPESSVARTIISKAKEIHTYTPSERGTALEKEVDLLVWEAFALVAEETMR